ncbi:hypothetical protein EJB05_36917, partial [Eragrostis curvula]
MACARLRGCIRIRVQDGGGQQESWCSREAEQARSRRGRGSRRAQRGLPHEIEWSRRLLRTAATTGTGSSIRSRSTSRRGRLLPIQRCPTFSRLKTLLMNAWCVATNIDPLVCMLEHSPVLENLTLLLSKGPKRSKDVEEKYGLLDRSPVISDTLKK